jgi:hypothetical protein
MPYTQVDVFSFGIILYELLSRYLTICAISINGTEAEVEAYAARVASGFRCVFASWFCVDVVWRNYCREG